MARPDWTSEDARERLREVRLSDEDEAALRRAMGERVKDARKLLGASRQDVAEVFGKSMSWIREIELGNTWPPHALLRALGAALGMGAGMFYESATMPSVARDPLLDSLAKVAEKIRGLPPQGVKEAAATLDVSVGYVWKLVSAGKITTTKEGRRTLVTPDSLAAYYASTDYAEVVRAKDRRRA